MKFFIDTANLEEIKEAQSLGILDGVTTNPSLMAKEGISGEKDILNHYGHRGGSGSLNFTNDVGEPI